MRTWVILCAVLAIAIAVSEAAPQSNRNKSPNPNVNLIRQGLIDKLCKRDERVRNGGSAIPAAATSNRGSRGKRQTRRGTTAAPPAGPSCNNYDNYTFEQLIQENRKLLRPVNRSTIKNY